MKYSKEQWRLLDNSASFVRLRGESATGKTTALVGYARQRASTSSLFIVKDMAQKRYVEKLGVPGSTKVETLFGLAYQGLGRPRYDRTDSVVARAIKTIEAVPLSLFQSRDQAQRLYQLVLALQTIEHFCHTGDKQITNAHTPYRKSREHREFTVQHVVVLARAVWQSMVERGRFLPTRAAVVKQWTLSQPLAVAESIIVDDAESCPVAATDFLLSHSGAKVIAGNDWQSEFDSYDDHLLEVIGLAANADVMFTQSYAVGSAMLKLARDVVEMKRPSGRRLPLAENAFGVTGSISNGQAESIKHLMFESDLARFLFLASKDPGETNVGMGGGQYGIDQVTLELCVADPAIVEQLGGCLGDRSMAAFAELLLTKGSERGAFVEGLVAQLVSPEKANIVLLDATAKGFQRYPIVGLSSSFSVAIRERGSLGVGSACHAITRATEQLTYMRD